MKPISTTEVRADLDAVLDQAQKEWLVFTRNGKPSVVVIGVEQYDAEDWELATSGKFWRMIEERRQGRMIPLAEVKKRLASAGRIKRPGKVAPKAPARRPKPDRQGKHQAKIESD